MKMFAVLWSNFLPLFKQAAVQQEIEVVAYSNKQISNAPEILPDVIERMRQADLILLYRTTDAFWDELDRHLRENPVQAPIVVIGPDPSNWVQSTVPPSIAETAYQYVLFNGARNFQELLCYLRHEVLQQSITYAPPEQVAWEGIFHPSMERIYSSTDEYLRDYAAWRGVTPKQFVAILYSRSNWTSGNLDIERQLTHAFEERGLGVIPVFFYSMKDKNLGNLSGVEVVEKFLMKENHSLVDGIVKLSAFFLGNTRGGLKEAEATAGACILKMLNVPMACPVISYYKTEEEWRADPQGLGSQVAWSIAMPEFEGAIEPLVVGATRGFHENEDDFYGAIEERVQKLAARMDRWIQLRVKPNAEKRVAFILNNNPCASVEASVGGGAHLDTLESVARILQRMKAEGYQVEAPKDSKELIDTIMSRKAISEFRWTPIEEIVAKGGVVARIDAEHYGKWFAELPAATRERMTEAWGNPPGEPKNGIPAAMVHEGNIVITGVRYGNALVAVQPKRGCAGARCDGQVCKILHDPSVPPPHQYVATYKWISRDFGADAIVHVGTHGNLEFLPGKGTGLSNACFSDIGIDTVPHLYIYNADNPPEGTIAKRRSYGTLIDHMQTVMVQGELYGDLEQIERLLEDYEKYRMLEPAKAHTIAHMIADKVKGLNLLDGKEEITHENVEHHVQTIHDKLSLLRDTYIPKGMHIFDERPEGDKLADFLFAILRFETGPASLRGLLTQSLSRERSLEGDALKQAIEKEGRSAIRDALNASKRFSEVLGSRFDLLSEEIFSYQAIDATIDDLLLRVQHSEEMNALLNGFNGGYIEPGPSGLITRGRSDVLPTGRNFYSLDPQRIPTPAAWRIGQELAAKTLEKYLNEEGSYPENVAFHWMAADIMWSDGEGMAQMLDLIGARPIWERNGRVHRFEIIPLKELGRPRIDITVRVSGITRDNFVSSIELLDEAVQAVANLQEPPEQNFIRKHSLEKLRALGEKSEDAWRQATLRIFASMPGTYQAGTQLAVYASAWKTDKDLSDVFLYWNGYGYGKGTFGLAAHASLKESLKSVDLTFSKTVSDEYDLTGCCCYFGTHGGLINAARIASGHDVKNYYGDTRDQSEVSVRTLTEEIRRIARAKILNPIWIEGMKEHGYKGAAEISKRVGRLYGWQATAQAVDDSVFDDAARTFMMDEENRRFFEENNSWALEEMARRLLEAAERGLWHPAPDVQAKLKDLYVEIEGWIEEKMDDIQGEFQGGSIDIINADEVEGWKKKMQEVLG
jgi:cobaltochelatase CobN